MAIGWYGWRTGSKSALPFGIPSPELGLSESVWGRDNPNVGQSQTTQTITPQTSQSSAFNISYLSRPGVLGATNTAPTYQNPTPQAPTNTTTQTQQAPSLQDAFNSIYGNTAYQGWDRAAAWADFQAKGGNLGGSSEQQTVDPYTQWLDQQYDAQNQSINELESSLPGQKSSMEQIAQNTYQQGANTLGSQFATNKGELEGYQTKTLQDIGDAIRNMWQQGGRILGARGAGDSSAAGMYNYAVSKLGSKQRGDVMQDVSQRLGKLKSIYDTNMQNLELEKGNRLQEISQWFADASNKIKGMRADLQAGKSEQALNLAIQMINQVNSDNASRRGLLDSWAASKAQSLPQLQQMMASNAAALPNYQGVGSNLNFGGSQGQQNLFGFGNTGNSDWLKNLINTG